MAVRAQPSWHTKATLAVATAAALAVLSIILTWLYLTPGHGKTLDSITVLPFANAGGDPSMEYLSDGITESLIGSLSQIPKLRVIAPSTVFTYKGRNLEPHKIGQELKVVALLQGKVTKLGETLVIEADLMNAADDTELWGEHYSRNMGDIFDVQSDIAREIADKLRFHLTGEEEKRLTKHYTESPEAYQLYWKGLYHSKQFTREGLEKGAEYFRHAIDKDPTYALAYDGLAYNYGVVVDWLTPPRDAMPKHAPARPRGLRTTVAFSHVGMIGPSNSCRGASFVTRSKAWLIRNAGSVSPSRRRVIRRHVPTAYECAKRPGSATVNTS